MFGTVVMALFAVGGLIDGLVYGAAERCPVHKGGGSCRVVWADMDYTYVQHMIDFYWALLTVCLIGFYISYQRFKALDRGQRR
ncbi:hypothetical protein D0B32_04860 [Paraburkholderia sp. DHOC27]|nr:hypothetical protein D0B32_04860 [Paraburkholderia sp. DHOC27]